MNDYSEPAFPSETNQYGPVLGVSMRDYFAAKALQGWCTHIGIVQGIAPTDHDMARYAYQLADAMIAEREK
jgi:hypothetical protein